MKIDNLKVNHLKEPMGYEMGSPSFSWRYTADLDEEILISRMEIAMDRNFQFIIHDSGHNILSSISYEPEISLEPRTTYFWRVSVVVSRQEVVDAHTVTSEVASFSTGKMSEPWIGEWLEIKGEEVRSHPIVRKSFWINMPISEAKIYTTALGLYELYINGHFTNDGYLQPGFNNYNLWLQYQTFDITTRLSQGENVIAFLLGDGWYKGRFGINGGYVNNFGSDYGLVCELHITFADGTVEIIKSDNTFCYDEGAISFSNIYDGEIYDATKDRIGWMQPGFDDSTWKKLMTAPVPDCITERYSAPVVVKDKLKAIGVLQGKQGEFILDFGQNMTGWLTFNDWLKKDESITLRFVEHMEDGEISQKNLLGAKQEFVYRSDGRQSFVRPHFTYYGFRYVQLTGDIGSFCPEYIEAWNLYTDLETSGEIHTGNPKINQLISNAYWSQRDNFLEHPSDCPQRSERLGWTGDAQIYCGTACYTMDSYVFFKKYIKDVNEEQKKKNGMVPFIVPKIAGRGRSNSMEDECSAAWSDVAVIIPWNLYLFYGDKNLLRTEYAGMKSWVDYMVRKDKENGDKKLWQSGFHFGDWLALDNPESGPFGRTDPFFIASSFYFYSMKILSKAAGVLGHSEDAHYYGNRATQVHQALLSSYFDENGVCLIDTQTAYAMSIYMDIVEDVSLRKNGEKLVKKISGNNGYLDTGFVGTPYLCPALTKAGFHEIALNILFNEKCPSWLYQVNQGATTIWESWDALDQFGKIKEKSSLNHYAFGSVVEWIYRDICGMNPISEASGFKKMYLCPHTDERLGKVVSSLETTVGTYKVNWERKNNHVTLKITIPYSGGAYLRLEHQTEERYLEAGDHEINYVVMHDGIKKDNTILSALAAGSSILW